MAEAIGSARFAGDAALIEQGLTTLRHVTTLRQLGRTYAGCLPRGVQTWEVPLHKPDILTAAHLVRAFTIG